MHGGCVHHSGHEEKCRTIFLTSFGTSIYFCLPPEGWVDTATDNVGRIARCFDRSTGSEAEQRTFSSSFAYVSNLLELLPDTFRTSPDRMRFRLLRVRRNRTREARRRA